jgi:hypothetical protein
MWYMYSHLYIMSRNLYMTVGNLCAWRSRAHHAGCARQNQPVLGLSTLVSVSQRPWVLSLSLALLSDLRTWRPGVDQFMI